jgi:hypothetical protein
LRVAGENPPEELLVLRLDERDAVNEALAAVLHPP